MSHLSTFVPVCGYDALVLMRCMGLKLRDEGGQLIVSGMAVLDEANKECARHCAAKWRNSILYWIQQEELPHHQRIEQEKAQLRDFWPLNRHYTAWHQVISAMRAHGLQALRCKDDFYISTKISADLLPRVITFLRCNESIILRNLRELEEG